MPKKIRAGGMPTCATTRITQRRAIVFIVAGLVSTACDLPSSNSPSTIIRRGDDASFRPSSSAPIDIPEDRRVTLSQALAYAEENAPSVLVARGDVALGDAEVLAARQAQPFNPTISVGLGQRRQGGGTGLDAQVALQQQLEVAGQRRRRRESAQRFRELTSLGLDAAAWSVHADVHWAFERALLAEERLALAQERVAVSQDLLRMVQRRVEVGDESSVVVEIAKADTAVAQNIEAEAAAEVETTRMMLARVVGSETAGLIPVGTLDAPSQTRGGAELARTATETNPALRQTDAATRVAEADLAVAHREAWPSPTVGVSFAREGSTSTPANFSPASTIWMGTLQIPIPSFARNQGAVARGRARVQVAEARHRAASVQFNSMVGSAAARVDAAAYRSMALESGVVTAFERSLVALRRAYDLGELGFLDVAQGLERLWGAREQALSTRTTYYDAFADLERLVGPLDTADSPMDRPFAIGTGDEAR